MLKKILIGLVVALAVLAGVISTRPGSFTLERSATIQAPAELVFARVNDFHRWNEWSPWDAMDPTMKRTFEGSNEGLGAIYSWVGNGQVGEGRMVIQESRPHELVRIELQFLKPMAATNMATFTFTRVGEATQVSWKMEGKNSFLGKAASMVMDMDKMVGGQFEIGLAAMKAKSEAEAQKLAAERAAAAAAAPPAAEAAPSAGTATAPVP